MDHYLSIMDKEGLQMLDISDGRCQVRLARKGKEEAALAAGLRPGTAETPLHRHNPAPAAKQAAIASPIAGVFYRAPSPNLPPFVQEGDAVSPGKILCIVEAMKVMNEIAAEQSGRIAKISVENGQPIEAGQTLFILDAA